ncbi:MAG: hypothetical protein JSW10_08765 [Pseudomonadota bacterium]|nr:MAG: hypothetical protein JSW10_08765 [Pseudomonadota bacterium]
MKTTLGLLFTLLLTGCAGGPVTPEGMYNGLQARQRMLEPIEQSTPTGEPLDYRTYEYERRRAIDSASH